MQDLNLKGHFPLLNRKLVCYRQNLPSYIKSAFENHLSGLMANFEKYFPQNNHRNRWIKEPFNADMNHPDYPKEESMADLSSDSKAQHLFNAMSLVDFWLSMQHKYPDLSKKALRAFIVFPTSYLCETGFSALASIKNKYRSKLDVEADMILTISKLVPRYQQLCNEHRPHTYE
ncbi:Zinc finger BED domain-containing protein 5 [Sarcoptes scabiei]|uniref:Zinc finger BED domain-containing protein 5 n=1 Tax=Sarcoptes scabiei TaxID=52283 RepID=A0A834R5R9_SARSC|nr:Zinc finger BED domain-containing protein 5 [Sarcoptes scabiei]